MWMRSVRVSTADAFEYLERELRIAGRIFSLCRAVASGAYAAHDGQCVAIMEWPTADQPLEPGEDYVKSDFDALRLARKATS